MNFTNQSRFDISVWLYPLLLKREFHFNVGEDINIEGELENGEWLINVAVHCDGHHWGCNRYKAGNISREKIIQRFVMMLIGQLSSDSKSRNKLLKVINHGY